MQAQTIQPLAGTMYVDICGFRLKTSCLDMTPKAQATKE
jgi:hypothetical protein